MSRKVAVPGQPLSDLLLSKEDEMVGCVGPSAATLLARLSLQVCRRLHTLNHFTQHFTSART